MKKIIILFVLMLATTVSASIYKTPGTGAESQFMVPFTVVDSFGNVVSPNVSYDSLYIMVWRNSGWSYADRMLLSDARIHDTTFNARYGLCFRDDFQDIDSSGGNGNYTWMIQVFDSTTGYWSYPRFGSANAGTSGIMERLDDILEALDSLQNQDNWVATSANQTLIIDTANASLDTIQNKEAWTLAGRDAIGDTAQGGDEAAASLVIIIDSLYAVIDSLQNHDNWVATSANQTLIIDTANATLDTLQLYDTRWGNVTDSINAILDSLQLYDTRWTNITDSLQAVLDTVQNYDNWLAAASMLTLVRDSVYATLDSIQASVTVAALIDQMTDSINVLDDDTTTLDFLRLAAAGGSDVTALTDSVNAILDSLQLYDTRWVAVTDSINAILDTLQLYDTRWVNVTDSLQAILDSIQAELSPNLFAKLVVDSADGRGFSNIDSLTGTLDAAQIGTDAIGADEMAASAIGASELATNCITSAELDGTVRDEINAPVIDTLVKIRDSVYATLDTSQNQDDWVSSYDPATDSVLPDMSVLNAGLDTGQIARAAYDNDVVALASRTVNADMISGDQTAAANVEALVDGTGGIQLKADSLVLKRIHVEAPAASPAAVTISNTFAGDALLISGGSPEPTNGTAVRLRVPGGTGSPINIDNSGSGSDIAADIDSSTFAPTFFQRFWDIVFSAGFVAGSMGDSLTNATYVQGSASGLSATEIMDSIRNDTIPVNVEKLAGDSASAYRTRYLVDGTGITKDVDVTMRSLEITNDAGSGLSVTGGTYGLSIIGATEGLHVLGGAIGGTFTGSTNYGLVATGQQYGFVVDGNTQDYFGQFDSTNYYGSYKHMIALHSDSGVAAGSDTSAILTALRNNKFARVATDTPIVLLSDGTPKTNIDSAAGTLAPAQLETDVITSAKLSTSAAQEIADSVFRQAVSDTTTNGYFATALRFVANTRDTVNVILDTLQDQDDSVNIYRTDKDLLADVVDSVLSATHGAGGWSFAGSGDKTVILYAIDTSGTDAARSDIKLTIEEGSSSVVWVLYSGSGGADTFYLANGTYTVKGSQIGYYFPSKSITVSANVTDTIEGYDINMEVGSPSSADLCRVFGYVYDVRGEHIQGAVITAVVSSSTNIVDSGTVSSIVSPLPVRTVTDTSGYFYIDLTKTTTVQDTTKGFYDIECKYRGSELFKINALYVPDQSSLNIADSLMGR